MPKLSVGDSVQRQVIRSIHGKNLWIPNDKALVHLQFRRFAGCPICTLHLHSVSKRLHEIHAAGVQEVVVFASSTKALMPYAKDMKFTSVGDLPQEVYRKFGVQVSGGGALMHPKAMMAAVQGMAKFGAGSPEDPAANNIRPAEFLIAPNGKVVARHYGSHANDQWTVDQMLNQVKRYKR